RKVSTGHVFTTQNLPPLQGQYISGPPWFSAYANGIIISNISQNLFTQSQPPPPPSGSQIQQFSSSISMMLSLNGGQSWSPVTAVANAAVQLASSMDANGTRFFNTEMLTLNIGGGTLPQGVLFRESPSKASLGRTSLKTNPASGQTLMESFFDIFTEVTVDGGQNWNAAVTIPGTVGVTPNPIAAFTIYCPSNMTVTATSSNGAVVSFLTTYLFPDCPFGPFVVTCTPPSGSPFPVGTTTVHCVGSDGCGEHPTCSFNVTVRPRLQFSGVINSIIGKAALQPVYPPNPGPPPHLRVSNLGSSGQDGFSIDAVGAESVLVNFLPFQVDVGTCAVSRVLGPSDLTLSEGTFFGGASPNVHADFSGVGASQCLVQVRDEFNNLIHSSVRQNGAIVDVNSFFPNPCPNGTSFYSISQGADFVWYKFCRVGCFCAGTNCTIERTICLRGINPSLLQKIATLEIRAQGVQNPSSLEVLSEEFEKFGRYHLALGDAALTGADRRLEIRNLGSSGQDGVAVDFLPNGGGVPDPVDRYRMRLLPVEINCPGACLRLSATGDFAGDPKHALGSASMTYDGQGNLQLNVDFSPIGSKSTRVDVYEGSKFVGTASVQGNFIGTLSGGGRLIACGKLPPPLPCFFGGFETTFKFAAADGTSLVGDEIRILAGNPSGPLKNLASFSVQACNVDRITILDEVLPEPPPRLTIIPLGSTAGYRICWSTTSSGLALQCSRGLEAPILWETVTNVPQVTLNTNYCVSLTGAQVGQRRFYRVAGPAQ
ncbi:MAG: exported protein of unknown function, partial [Verrucomicrobiales bacterium]|nr:exported protein of unknown function [Verrucomicrobiales bacterium]